MRTTISHSLSFGREGNASQVQQRGWSGGEDGYTWALGPESELLLPNITAPRGFYIEIRCGPYGSQRLHITIDDEPIASTLLRYSGTFAWYAPPVTGTIRITFRHPDARRPRDFGDSNDDRPLAQSFRRLRILPLVAAEPPVREAIEGDVGSDIAARFESIGDNCELGLLQRALGAEPLGLLRFSSAPLEQMLDGLDSSFAGIEDRLEALAIDGAWSMYAPRYGMRWHTFLKISDATAVEILERERKRLRFLVAKFMQDVESGDKIFVVKRTNYIPPHELLPLLLALRRHGAAPLLCMSSDASRAGTTEIAGPGLFLGYLTSFGGPGDIGSTLRREEWLSVIREASSHYNAGI